MKLRNPHEIHSPEVESLTKRSKERIAVALMVDQHTVTIMYWLLYSSLPHT